MQKRPDMVAISGRYEIYFQILQLYAVFFCCFSSG